LDFRTGDPSCHLAPALRQRRRVAPCVGRAGTEREGIPRRNGSLVEWADGHAAVPQESRTRHTTERQDDGAVCDDGALAEEDKMNTEGPGSRNAGGGEAESGGHFAIRAGLSEPYEAALARLEDALKAEGFGILTAVDMQATLKAKLGAEFRKYRILGVCNPPLALRALTQELEAGLVLPRTIVIYEDGPSTRVSIGDPLSFVDVLRNPALRPIAEEARKKLDRVLRALSAGGAGR